jgi:hypothetical protein
MPIYALDIPALQDMLAQTDGELCGLYDMKLDGSTLHDLQQIAPHLQDLIKSAQRLLDTL